MRKYKPIYSLILLVLLSFNSSAQDTTQAASSYMFNFGLNLAPSDYVFNDINGNTPKFGGIDVGFNKKVDDRFYIGINTGRLSAKYENLTDSSYYRINHLPLGITFGLWSRKKSEENLGLEFSAGVAFPTKSELKVRSATYFSAKWLIFLNKNHKQKSAISVGYKAINNTLMDFTYARRDFFTVGYSLYTY